MKKLVALMLVFGMASMASAALQISVNGNMDPIDTEINLLPSETIMLDVWTTTAITPGVGEGYFAIYCVAADGTISGGVNVSPEPSVIVQPYDMFPPVAGVYAGITLATAAEIPAQSVILDEIMFHCEWQPNDVLIELIYDVGFPVYGVSQVVDSVIIHQIPEPATMALLSLGGLFLLRRRK